MRYCLTVHGDLFCNGPQGHEGGCVFVPGWKLAREIEDELVKMVGYAGDTTNELRETREDRDEAWRQHNRSEIEASMQRERAEAAEARLGEAHRECARLESELRSAMGSNAALQKALADDGHDFGDEAIEDLIRVYYEQPHGASADVTDEARKAGRDARAARRAREALAGPGSEQSSLTESGSAGLPDTPPPERDEWEARCHFCGGPCYPWLTDDGTWAKVEPILGQQQACFECFAAAWFKLGHNNGEPFRVSAGPDTPADSPYCKGGTSTCEDCVGSCGIDTPDNSREVVWLVERGQSLNHVPTVWLCQEEPYDFSPDPLRAIRYPTREAAEAVIAEHTVPIVRYGPWAVAVEHVFVDTPADNSEKCPKGGTHARIAHPGGRCIKCGGSPADIGDCDCGGACPECGTRAYP